MQKGGTFHVFEFLQGPSVLFLEALLTMLLSYQIKCSPRFQIKIRNTQNRMLKAKENFREVPWVFRLVMFLSICHRLQLFLTGPVMCQQILPINRSDSTGHTRVAASKQITWELISPNLCLLNDACIFYPLWPPPLNLWSNSKRGLKWEKERKFWNMVTYNFAIWVFFLGSDFVLVLGVLLVLMPL